MAENIPHYQDYETLIELIKNSGRRYDVKKIEKAYNFALEAHGDQRRVSGVPYILHPTSVACILVDYGMDTDTIIAALLHDVVEDTDIPLDVVKKEFGEAVAVLTDGVTKLKKIPDISKESQQAENVRKMLMAMSSDIRVIVIKLADRVHNMRTINCMPEEKRRNKARENMEVFAPIAHRLGIRTVKHELEDLSMRYLDPVGYCEIERSLFLTDKGRQMFIESIKKDILLKTNGIIDNVKIEGRVKSINSIYRKTIAQGKSMEEIFDIFAVRVIVDTLADCYHVLGIIHDIFNPIPNRFKDYISTPKQNMYQSLHTVVIGKEGIPFEVQIRTYEMHKTAEYGIAAHWKYKIGMDKKDVLEEKVAWIRTILENQSDDDHGDILKDIKTDLASESVYIYTPKGDVKELPQGSIVIDVAYAIHSEVGNRMQGAKVNGRIVPIDYKVKTGEIVEIITRKENGTPNRDWLKIVKTSEARSKIRQWFKKEKKEENIAEGKAELLREFKAAGISIPEKEITDFIMTVFRKKQYSTIEELYESIGYGGVQLWKIMPRLKEEYSKLSKPTPTIEEIIKKSPPKKKRSSSGIIVEGVDDMLIKISKCCNPLPGDEIIGFITRGFGVSIHNRNCPNVPKNIEECDCPHRWIKAEWASDVVKEQFQTKLTITGVGRTGLLADITMQLTSMHIYINSMDARETNNNIATLNFSITVDGKEQLDYIMGRVKAVKDVITVERG